MRRVGEGKKREEGKRRKGERREEGSINILI